MSHQGVGELLLKAGLIQPDGLARAIEIQRHDGRSLTRIIADLGLTGENDAARAVATGLGLDYVDLATVPPPAAETISLPLALCRKRLILPLGVEGRALRLAMVNPLDASTIQDIEFRTSHWVKSVVVTETALLKALKAIDPSADAPVSNYDLLLDVVPEGELEPSGDGEFDIIDPAKVARDLALPPIVRLVNMLLTDAAKAGASDIHIEPQEGYLLVRHRIDGLLQDVMKIPKHLQQSTLSRLKIISGMDIAERRKPQDGRSRLRVDKRRIDLRVSALPTHHGEKVVIRLLDSASARTDISLIGFAPDIREAFQGLLSRPQGMILVTGPTGSGKTSTLYASLNWLKSPTRNVITVEDPIEYELEGINQVQINTRAGVTFAGGLRSILRQDPNIVLVGEIRDQETAGIALEAAQTGHLLLSTLHTNDAPSSVTRLIDLGIEPFLIASSVAGILAQRLVRRVCSECAVDRPPAAATLDRFAGFTGSRPAVTAWKAGAGCDACRHSGYRGRLAIHELLVMTDAVREQVSRRAPDHQIRDAARRSGMRLLLEDGFRKAAEGLTTLDEVLRTAPGGSETQTAPSTSTVPRASVMESAGTATSSVAASGDGGAKPRALVVEDSPTVVTVVKYFLELEGFEVLVAADGLAGLEIARRERPDVVVSDLNMPGMDGLALIKALRSDPATRGMAILMLTSDTSVESETAGLESGADDYLLKPVEPRRLAARVKATLARTRARLAQAA